MVTELLFTLVLMCAALYCCAMAMSRHFKFVGMGAERENLAHAMSGPCTDEAVDKDPLACLHAMCSFEDKRHKWRQNLSASIIGALVMAPLVIVTLMAYFQVSMLHAFAAWGPIMFTIVVVGSFVTRQVGDFFYTHGHIYTYDRCREITMRMKTEGKPHPLAGWTL